MVRESCFGERLRTVMNERGLSYEQLGNLLNMNPQTLNRYALGQREPKADRATNIAVALEVPLMWLQGYDVPRYPTTDKKSSVAGERVVPILGSIRAGVATLAVQDIEGYAATDVSNPEDCFYLRVSGDSMINAGIKAGDLVLLRRQSTADNGQIVACLVDGEEATLKRFRVQRDMVILQPENPAYEPRIVPCSDFEQGNAHIVGVAVKLVRDL